jgi:hypothetical protein
MPDLTALHDQAEMATREEFAILAETYRLLAARVGDPQATADLTSMLAARDKPDLALCLAYAVRQAARNA